MLKVFMAHKNKSNYSPYKARQTNGKSSGPLKGKHRKAEVIFELGEADDRLRDIFQNHELDIISHEQRNQLAKFYRLLMLNQEKENFTRLLTLREVAIKHFIDSIIILKHTNLSTPLLDMGTGPGFPGIPLKIMLPENKIILAEGVQKRVNFLKSVREELKLQNLDIIGRNVNPEFEYPVQGVITRAVEDIRNSLNNIINCLQVGGRAYFMKGPGVDPEIKMANEACSGYYKFVDDIHYSIPHTPNQRRLVIYEKIKNPDLLDEE